MSRVDLHIHSTASDGRLTPAEVVREAAGRGLSYIALADHDTVGGIAAAMEAAKAFPGLSVIPAIEKGFFQREIAEAAYRYQTEIDTHQRVVVGVNEHLEDDPVRIPLLEMDPEGYDHQVARLESVRRQRDNEHVGVTLEALRAAAQGTANTMPYILDCVRAYATLGEIMGVFREVFGEYREPTII